MIKKTPAKLEIVNIYCDSCDSVMVHNGEMTQTIHYKYVCDCGEVTLSQTKYPYSDITPLTEQ